MVGSNAVMGEQKGEGFRRKGAEGGLRLGWVLRCFVFAGLCLLVCVCRCIRYPGMWLGWKHLRPRAACTGRLTNCVLLKQKYM